jgi:hypothetical protein
METKGPAKRVLISIGSQSSYLPEAWDQPEKMIKITLVLLEKEMMLSPNYPADVLYVARERWGPRTHIVFDIFNVAYDPDMAHIEGQNDLSVIAVFFTRKEDVTVSNAGMPVANHVNKEVRDIHDLTGPKSRPPFSIDHADGKIPSYPNPRVTGR